MRRSSTLVPASVVIACLAGSSCHGGVAHYVPVGTDASATGDGGQGPDAQVEELTTWVWQMGAHPRRYGTGIVEMDDGGVAFAGFLEEGDLGESEGWVVRLSRTGEVLWQLQVGGAEHEWIHDLVRHPDGGLVLVGHSSSFFHGGGWILHLDAEGAPVWQRSFTDGAVDTVAGIDRLPSGGYVLAGSTSGDEDGWVGRIDDDGTLLWQIAVEDEGGSSAATAHRGGGGAFVATSRATISGDVPHTWLARLDEDGSVLWQRLVAAGSTNSSSACGVAEAIGGDALLVVGLSVLRFTPDGDLLWSRRLSGGSSPSGGGVVAGPSGGAILTGGDTPFGGAPDVWLMGLDRDGETLWHHTVRNDELCEIGYDLALTRDGGVVAVTGGCNSAVVLKLGQDGTFVGDCPVLTGSYLATALSPVEVTEHHAPSRVGDATPAPTRPEVAPLATPIVDLCAP